MEIVNKKRNVTQTTYLTPIRKLDVNKVFTYTNVQHVTFFGFNCLFKKNAEGRTRLEINNLSKIKNNSCWPAISLSVTFFGI